MERLHTSVHHRSLVHRSLTAYSLSTSSYLVSLSRTLPPCSHLVLQSIHLVPVPSLLRPPSVPVRASMPHDGDEVRRRLDEEFGADNWLEGCEHGWSDTAATAAAYFAVPQVGTVLVDQRLRRFGSFGLRACEWVQKKKRAGRLTFGARRVIVYERPFGRARITIGVTALFYAAFIPS